MRPDRRPLLALIAVLAGCQASTTRPGFLPVPEVLTTELRLGVPEATELLAERLAADSFLIRRVEPRDGYLEGEWTRWPPGERTETATYNPSVTKVRAWIDPAHQFWSKVSVEIVYRVAADPSREPRDFERSIAPSHTLYQRLDGVLRELTRQHGNLVEEKPGATPRTP